MEEYEQNNLFITFQQIIESVIKEKRENPKYEKLLKKFVSQYDGRNLTKVGQFEPFKKTINKIFGTGTQTLEEKVVSLLL